MMNPPVGTLGNAEAGSPSARDPALERQQPAGTTLPRAATDHAQEYGGDFVRQNEFRLFKWLATFLVAAVAAAIALLYQQVAEVRVEMERLRTDLVQEMNRQHADLRDEMARQFADVRENFADVRKDIASLRERMVRVETLVGGDGDAAG